MSNVVEVKKESPLSNYDLNATELALVMNDLSKLTAPQRVTYVKALCDSVGLNHLTNPFAYIVLNGKLTLYAKKDATEQLRKIHSVSTQIISIAVNGEFVEVHIKGKDKSGREDEDFASVHIKGLGGDALANAKMKCITKAKRRVTLSICGLGILDEAELESIPAEAKRLADNPQIANPFKQETVQEAPLEEVEVTSDAQDLGEYICKVGKKYAGKKLSEIEVDHLGGYLDWLEKKSADQSLTGDWLEFYTNGRAYLSTVLPPEPNDDEIPY